MMQGHSPTAAAAGGEGHARWQQEPSCIKVIASEATWSCIKSFNFFQEKELLSLFHDLLRFYLKFVMFLWERCCKLALFFFSSLLGRFLIKIN